MQSCEKQIDIWQRTNLLNRLVYVSLVVVVVESSVGVGHRVGFRMRLRKKLVRGEVC